MDVNKSLEIEILSPEGLIYKGSASEVVIPTLEGEIGVLPGHIPLIAEVSEGEITVTPGSKAVAFAVIGGFLEVLENKVSVLADYAVRSDEIESLKAEEARRRAETLLKEKHGRREFAYLERDLRKSLMELKISQKYRKKR